MRVALYARVSSDKQDVDLSVSAQLKALREYAVRHGHQVVREFVDEAESGRTVNRPVFQEMIAEARKKARPFGGILVWKLSRFARNREDSIIHKSLLRKHGVQVISINEPVDNTPTGRMLEGMIEVIDEFYSSNLAEDVVRGMREASSRGFWVNSGRPYGYRRVLVDDGSKQRVRLAEDETVSWVVRRIFEEAFGGKGVKEIANGLNEDGVSSPKGKRWGRGQVHRLLTNEIYTGTLVWGTNGKYHRDSGLAPVRVANAFPGIIDPPTFQALQSDLRGRAPRVAAPRRVSSPYLLSGLLRCAECGASMYGMAAKSGKFHYYVCASAYRLGRTACSMTSAPRDLLDRLVTEAVQEVIMKSDHIEELLRITNEELSRSLAGLGDRIDGLNNQASEIDQRLDRLYDAVEKSKLTLDDLAPRIQDLRTKREHLARAISESKEAIENGGNELLDREAIVGYLSELPEILQLGTVAERRTVLKSFITEIVKDRDHVIIRYGLPVPTGQAGDRETVLDFTPRGGAEGIRTLDPLNAIEVLSQLSYSPTETQYTRGPRPAQHYPNMGAGFTRALSCPHLTRLAAT